MKFKKILTIGIKETSLESEYWKIIDELSEERISLSADSDEIDAQLKNTDCLLINPFVFEVKKEHINQASELKYISVLATAYGKVDCDYATTKNIAVTNIPDYSTEAVAEFVFGTILENLRDLERAKKQAREGDYSENTFFNTTEIKGKKFGIIGLGNIGARVSEFASVFGAEVSYWSKNRKKGLEEASNIKFQDVQTIFSECDFISLHLAFNNGTEQFVNNEMIGKIKKGAIFINTAPNELVNLEALEKRLSNNDMTYIMDHSDELSLEQAEQFSKHKNCIIYPPIGYTTEEASKEKQEVFVGNIRNFLKGEATNKVNL